MDSNGMYDSLLEKIRHFVALYEKVKTEKAALEQTANSLQKQVAFLQNENNQLKTEYELLKMKTDEQTNQIAELSSKVANQNNVNTEIESKLMALLSALPDDKDDASAAEASAIDLTQPTGTDEPQPDAHDIPQNEMNSDDLSDAILNKFYSDEPQDTLNLDNPIGGMSMDGVTMPAAEQNEVAADSYVPSDETLIFTNESESTNAVSQNDNDLPILGERAESSLFGDDLPTEEEWNAASSEQNVTSQESDVSANAETFQANGESKPNDEPEHNGYEGDIQNDDYNSILFDDSESDEEIDFDDVSDDEDSAEDEDLSAGDYEDGYAPGVM